MKEITVEQAMKVIKQAMVDDNPEKRGGYAHSWHCNIAMMCFDAIKSELGDQEDPVSTVQASKIGNDAASRFMKICFDVETTQ